MNPLEEVDQLLRLAESKGLEIRHEYFGGTGGGICEFGGKKYLFVDLALSTTEQLERLKVVLAEAGFVDTSSCESEDIPGTRKTFPPVTMGNSDDPMQVKVGFRSTPLRRR